MSTQLLNRPTPTPQPSIDRVDHIEVKPSLILHHAARSARRQLEQDRAAEQLLRALRPTRQAISEAYLMHVRRIHRRRSHGAEASRTLSILEAALHRRPRDVVL